MATRGTTRKKPAAKKPAARKTPARKPAAKKTTTRKTTTARKPAARKAPARKPAARKAPARKPAAKPAAAAPVEMKKTPVKDKMTKTQMLQEIADAAGVTRAQATKVIDNLGNLMERHLGKRGLGEFTMPGLFKIITIKKPAQKARKGINPFTGEETMFKAKPARTMVKVRPLKKLKEMAS